MPFTFSLGYLGGNENENFGKIQDHWQLAPVFLCCLISGDLNQANKYDSCQIARHYILNLPVWGTRINLDKLSQEKKYIYIYTVVCPISLAVSQSGVSSPNTIYIYISSVKMNIFVLNKSTRIIFHLLPTRDTHSRDAWMRVCIFCFLLLQRRLWFLFIFSQLILSICIHFITGPLSLLCVGTSEFDL